LHDGELSVLEDGSRLSLDLTERMVMPVSTERKT
jgi:hypothetical protein